MMHYSELGRDPWASAREWVARWDGHERDVYLLDIPESRVLPLVGEIERCTTNIEVHPADGVACLLTPSDLHKAPELYLNGQGIGNLGIVGRVRGLPLQLYLARCGEGLYDLDIVFWADKVFGDNRSEDERRRTFHGLVQLALDLCEIACAKRIILVDHGDPRESPSYSGIVIWEEGQSRAGGGLDPIQSS